MTKLKFTKKHAGWFIWLTTVGVLLGWTVMRDGFIETMKTFLFIMFMCAFLVMLLWAINAMTSDEGTL